MLSGMSVVAAGASKLGISPAPSSPVAQVSSPQPAPTTSVAQRWDWLAGTQWYVKPENLLAYLSSPDLANPIPTGDQTIWHIVQSANGQITGEATVTLSTLSSTMQKLFVGVVTPEGQIRIEFSNMSGGPTTGIGQMRFEDGAWRMEMQMATSTSVLVTHWAYMSQLHTGVTPPPANTPGPGDGFLSTQWRWFQGSKWTLADSRLPGGPTAQFTITHYNNGYYWGSGTTSGPGALPLNVLGSVTPEGNLLFVISVNGQSPITRSGQLTTAGSYGQVALRSYDGNPGAGSMWTLDVPTRASASAADAYAYALATSAKFRRR